ncbi:uncharacterized protein BXIN_2924 [Babesia sp. Xinjiang]|uniref:uncharacterized protein n=1 Tax=Babesia sp. Xinjiang TaxID=462227 RepID=UPI000A2590A3|nr:uncharacterized protein BXIN_2924 [Babesia sp. Xinjiang]ORM39538.1 hypothetical protein BXIN_2924 [Babesia sp. Xinjiang]
MWIDNLRDRYGKKSEPTSPESDDDPFRRESEANVRRVCVSNFFDVDVLGRRAVDRSVARRRGFALLFCSLFSICLVFYMWYQCYHASCDECVAISDGGVVEENTEVECHCANCVVQWFFSPVTHFEKCYYSLLFFCGVTLLYFFSILRDLALQIFCHSNILQRD